MGSGKTTHGKKLAKLLGYNFIDLDELISHNENLSVSELFELKGEKEFRHIETQTLKSIIHNSGPFVISLGGGTPCFNQNLDLLKKEGVLIYIQMPPKALFNRLITAKEKRPLLKNKTDQELLPFIENLLKQREEYYLQAAIIVDGINLDLMTLKEQILSIKTSA